MRTGVLMTNGKSGAKFWFPCADAQADGVAASLPGAGYGSVLAEPGTKVEFVTDDGDKYTTVRVIRETPRAEPTVPPAA